MYSTYHHPSHMESYGGGDEECAHGGFRGLLHHGATPGYFRVSTLYGVLRKLPYSAGMCLTNAVN